MSNYMNNMRPEAWSQILQQHEEQRKMAEAFNRGKIVGADEERAKMATQKLLAPPAPSHQQIANEVLLRIAATLGRIEQEIVTVKRTDIRVKGIDYKPDKDGNLKVTKKDTAPPHVRQGRRRKAGKVTGVRAAK